MMLGISRLTAAPCCCYWASRPCCCSPAWARATCGARKTRWANIALQMLQSGDYFDPYLKGVPYYDKPLPSYWLITCAAHLMGGLGPWSLRLPVGHRRVVECVAGVPDRRTPVPQGHGADRRLDARHHVLLPVLGPRGHSGCAHRVRRAGGGRAGIGVAPTTHACGATLCFSCYWP